MMALLTDELLANRVRLLSTSALDKIDDALHVFFECRTCRRRTVSITVIAGNPHGVMNNLPALAKLLLDTPERLIPGAKSSTCSCGSAMRLESLILCRTNPQKGNDFHLRVRYHDNTIADDTFTAALLFPDGRYVHVPHEQLVRLLVPGRSFTPADRLRALREPRLEISDEEKRWEEYQTLLGSGEIALSVLREGMRDAIGRLLAHYPELQQEPAVEEALAVIALPLDDPDLERRALATAAPMNKLRAGAEGEIEIALQAIHCAAWLVPDEGVVEATANAVQLSAARARREVTRDRIDPRLREGGYDSSSVGVSREITAQIEKLLSLLA